MAFEAGAGPVGGDRQPVRAREGEDPGDVLCRAGVDDQVGPRGAVEGQIRRMEITFRVAVPDVVGADRLAQRLRRSVERRAHVYSRSDGSPGPPARPPSGCCPGRPARRARRPGPRRRRGSPCSGRPTRGTARPSRGRGGCSGRPARRDGRPRRRAAGARSPGSTWRRTPSGRGGSADVLLLREAPQVAQRLLHARDLDRPDGARARSAARPSSPSRAA